jgi:hypothetical protein
MNNWNSRLEQLKARASALDLAVSGFPVTAGIVNDGKLYYESNLRDAQNNPSNVWYYPALLRLEEFISLLETEKLERELDLPFENFNF